MSVSSTARAAEPDAGPARTVSPSLWLTALLMPLGPAAIAVTRYVLPYDNADSSAVLVAKVAADPGAMRLALWTGVIGLLTLVPGAVAVLGMTRPGAPRLTAVTAALLIPGYLALAGLVAGDIVLLAGVQAGIEGGTLAALMDAVIALPMVSVLTGVFVLGHLVGSVLLGVAMWRSRVVPAWAAVTMAVSQPVHLVAAITGNHPLDLIGWGATAVAMGVAAGVLVRGQR